MKSHTLILVRHATAEYRGARSDHSRTLTEEGRQQARELGRILAQHIPEVDAGAYSDAQRTTQTYHLITEHMKVMGTQWSDKGLYMAAASDLIDYARTLSDERSLLLVGHEPTISHAGSVLARGSTKVLSRGVPTATAVICRFTGEWADLAPECAEVDILHVDRLGQYHNLTSAG